MKSENMLRRQHSQTPMIITFAVMLIFLFLLVSYGIYCIMDYQYANGITGENMDMGDYTLAVSSMTSAHTLPFTAEVLGQILQTQLSIWYVYVGVILCIFIYATSRSRNDFKNMEHGSARWANKEEIKAFKSKDKKGIPLAFDAYLPPNSNKVANLNEIVIGGPGAGKSFRKIKPDILQLNGSYVVTDPKGELYRDTAKLLKEHGYKVRVLNLVDVRYSNSYNPFKYIENEQDVLDISSLFMKNTATDGEKEDFFTGAAQKLLTALMLYLFKSKNEIKTFGRVIRLLNSIRYKNGSIDMQCELARCLNEHATDYPNDAASINWSGMQANAQETQASINEVLSTRLSLWATTALDAITSTDEMNFDTIGTEKTAVFLILPIGRNTYRVVANLFYTQLFERLRRVATEKYDGCLPLLVSCELDEFANYGEIPNFNETLSTSRSYNIRICIVLQGLSQLKARYEKMHEAIISNCDIFTLLGSKDKDTLDYVSEKLGKITVRNDSRSFNRGGTGGGGQDTEASGERSLLTPDEIRAVIKPKGKTRKYGGKCIVWVGYEYPMCLLKYDTPSHPLFEMCGSKYEKYKHNNTYIDKEYAAIYKQRIEAYEKMYAAHNRLAEADKLRQETEKRISEEREQREMAEDFEEAGNVTIEPPAAALPTEEEYEEYTNRADRYDYSPVPDFDDEGDDIFDDINPMVEKLKTINKGV